MSNEAIIIPKFKLPPLYKKQRMAIYDDVDNDTPARVRLCLASTKSGKTSGALVHILEQAMDAPNTNHLWGAPGYGLAKMAWERLGDMLALADPERRYYEMFSGERYIRLANNAKIYFKGVDNFNAIYGNEYHSAILDEFSRCSEDAYNAIYSTLSTTRGSLVCIGNVTTRNWAWKLCQKAQGGEEGMCFHEINAMDAVNAGVLAQESLDDAKAQMSEMMFNSLYLNILGEDGGCPFNISKIDQCIRNSKAGETVVFGVDVAAMNDWTVCVGLDEANIISEIHRFRTGDWKVTNERIAKIIKDTPTLLDSTGGGLQSLHYLQGVCSDIEGFTFTNASKQGIMEGLSLSIQNLELSIPNNTEEAKVLISELKSFQYERSAKGKFFFGAPSGQHDDCVCALALVNEHRGSSRLNDNIYVGFANTDGKEDDDRLWSDW